MTPQEQQFHWQEGMKYSMECVKALLWLNGGAPIALLSFFGNRNRILATAATDAIDRSLTCFAVGIVAGVLVYVLAYFAQLCYGNEGFSARARAVHISAYVPLFVSLCGFIAGIIFAKIAVVAALT
jgi:hypothetical protein